MRVLALVTLPTLGASNRLRIEQYAPTLRGQGIELTVSAFFDAPAYRRLYIEGATVPKLLAVLRGIARRAGDVIRAGRFDLVIVHRESAPLGPPIIEQILARAGIPYVFDFDDAVFLGQIHRANRRWSWLRSPSRTAESVRGANSVIAGNEYLAAWARQHNPRVAVLPTPVDTDRFVARRPRTATGPVVLGWVGSSTTAPYLRLLDEALDAVRRRRDIVVRVVGGEYTHPSVAVECLPYRLAEEPADVARLDIGLLPEPDDAWTRGKGAFKALLYMATAVPVVASRVGVNHEVIGEGGLIVSTTAEWVEALDRLIADPQLRLGLGEAGRVRAEATYSLRVVAPRFASALREAAASR